MLWLWLCLLVGRGYLHALQDCHEGKKKEREQDDSLQSHFENHRVMSSCSNNLK